MSVPNISVTSTNVRVFVGDFQYPALPTNPAGSYVMPDITVNTYGQITAATQNNDIAAITTQAQLSAAIDALVPLFTGGVNGQTWGIAS